MNPTVTKKNPQANAKNKKSPINAPRLIYMICDQKFSGLISA